MAGPCSMADCDKRARCRGLCDMHYTRLRVHGDPNVVVSYGRPRQPVVNWSAIHYRQRADNGPASNYPCVDCGNPAAEWSHEGELTFRPRCVPCHRFFDREIHIATGRRNKGSKAWLGFIRDPKNGRFVHA